MADEGRRAPVGSVAVMFADITGSSALYVQRGDQTAFALNQACLDVLDAQVRWAGGRVVKRLGDGILAVFETPGPAVEAAAAVREAIGDPAAPTGREAVRVRAGISFGRAVLTADDVYGDIVNVAARLVGLADGDEIFLSAAVYEVLSPTWRQRTRLIAQLPLRNRPGAVLVYELTRASGDETVHVGTRIRVPTASLEITHGERLFVIGPERPRLTIGRQPDSDILIAEDAVSRTHAEIALRADKFVLIDRSTNGTYVYVDGGAVLRAVREEIVLSGSGRIVAGVERPDVICYRVTA